LNLHLEVVAVHSGNSVLDAMQLMSDLGVSSVAVLKEEGGSLLSAVSVTDIGQVCAEQVDIIAPVDLLMTIY
jgi:predicted transcriptional regulator